MSQGTETPEQEVTDKVEIDTTDNQGAMAFFTTALKMYKNGVHEMMFEYDLGEGQTGKLKINMTEVTE